MRILAFSDWGRVQSIEELIEYAKRLDKKPDVIVYAGDDIDRFNNLNSTSTKNYLEELASYSKYGLLAVAGNEDFADMTAAISGHNVHNLYLKSFPLGGYVFVGLEGTPTPPHPDEETSIPPTGVLHPEKEVKRRLDKELTEFPDKKIIIVSHAPPFEILDTAVQFGVKHIGSVSLRKFIDRYSSRIKVVFCGHVHSQGGKNIIHRGVPIVNCASHDDGGAPGKICVVDLSEEDFAAAWDLVHNDGAVQNELTEVPLIGYRRARVLLNMSIQSIEQLANYEGNMGTAECACLPNYVFEMSKNYAKAIIANKPIVTAKPPLFKEDRKIYFFDAEYRPFAENSRSDKPLIFLLGIMSTNGKIKQHFLDNPEKEEELLNEFREWLKEETPILVTYASTSAEKPQLKKAFKRWGMPTTELKNVFFDLYYDCIFTQNPTKQVIFLPVRGQMSVKDVSVFLGYQEHESKISDGIGALSEYNDFLTTGDNQSKNELLDYNKSDLERTKFIFDVIKKLIA